MACSRWNVSAIRSHSSAWVSAAQVTISIVAGSWMAHLLVRPRDGTAERRRRFYGAGAVIPRNGSSRSVSGMSSFSTTSRLARKARMEVNNLPVRFLRPSVGSSRHKNAVNRRSSRTSNVSYRGTCCLEQAEAVRVYRPHERRPQPVKRLRPYLLFDAGGDPGLQLLCCPLGERERDGKTAGSRTSRSRRICRAEHPVRCSWSATDAGSVSARMRSGSTSAANELVLLGRIDGPTARH